MPVDLTFLFLHCTTIENLDFSDSARHFQVSVLDLSNQLNLQLLNVALLSFNINGRATLVHLPDPCNVHTIAWSTATLRLTQDWRSIRLPALTKLFLRDARFAAFSSFAPLPLVAIMRWSTLQSITAESSAIDASQPDGQGRSGAVLVHYWLAHRMCTNP